VTASWQTLLCPPHLLRDTHYFHFILIGFVQNMITIIYYIFLVFASFYSKTYLKTSIMLHVTINHILKKFLCSMLLYKYTKIYLYILLFNDLKLKNSAKTLIHVFRCIYACIYIEDNTRQVYTHTHTHSHIWYVCVHVGVCGWF
jgi:hypothetical protein